MEDLAPDRIASELRAGVGPLHRRLRSLRGARDLGDTAADVLIYLHDHGPASPSTLSSAFQVKPGSMSQTVTRLLDGNFISRTVDPDDRRRVLLTATPDGERHVQQSRDQRQRWLAERIADLDDADRQVLARAAAIMLELSRT